MASEWREVRLGDLGRVITGRTPPGTKEIYFGGDVLFLTPTDMDGRRVCSSTLRTLSCEGAEQLSRVVVSKGVAVSCIGWQMGKSMLIDRSTATNQQINTIVPHDGVDESFLYYALTARKNELFALGAGGSRTPILNKSIFQSFLIEVPSYSAQQSIAEMLQALDNQIELLDETNGTLESLARTVFKSWFVDFDPVRAKGEGREPDGMDHVTAALFPRELVNSEIGDIPAGWDLMTAGDLVEVDKGLSYKGASLTDAGMPMINLGCFSEGGRFDSHKLKHYNGEYKSRHTVVPGDLVIANTDITQKRLVIGSPIIVPDLDTKELLFTHHTYAIRPKVAIEGLREFLYFTLLQSSFRDRAVGFATGTTVLALPKDAILKLEMVIPPKQLLHEFLGWAGTFNDKLNCNRKLSETLAVLRDTLLPRLITGKLTVPQAEKLVESVL